MGKVVDIAGRQQFIVAVVGAPVFALLRTYPVGDAMPRCEMPAENTCSRRTANPAGGVALCEHRTLFRNSVDVGRFVEFAPCYAQVFVPEVVHQNEYDVRFFGWLWITGYECQGKKEND